MSVPMLLYEFAQRKRDWRIKYSQDFKDGELEHMDQYIESVKKAYVDATWGGPYNGAETQLRDAFDSFKTSWDTELATRASDRRYREAHAMVNPYLMNQIEGAIEEPMPVLQYPSFSGQSSSSSGRKNAGQRGGSSSRSQGSSQQGSSSSSGHKSSHGSSHKKKHSWW